MFPVSLQYAIECVMHFAALKAVGESCRLPLQYYQNNITGTSVLLETMAANNVHKIVYSSSATVYGEPEFLPLTEEHPTGNCTNPYGKSKYFTEEILKDLCESDKVRIIIEFNRMSPETCLILFQKWSVISLRYFNPVGAHPSGEIGEDPNGEPNNLMPYIAQVAVGRRPFLNVFGTDYPTPDGTGVRDYIHIVDLADGHVKSLDKFAEKDFHGFATFNLGTGSGTSVFEMVHAFERASGQTVNYQKCPRRAGDVATSYADPALAAKCLGWRAKLNVDEMCQDTWRWQKKNPNGFAGSHGLNKL